MGPGAWQAAASCLEAAMEAASNPAGKEAHVAMYEGYCVKDREKVQFEARSSSSRTAGRSREGICPEARDEGDADPGQERRLGPHPRSRPGSVQAGSGACGASSAGTVSFNPERSAPT